VVSALPRGDGVVMDGEDVFCSSSRSVTGLMKSDDLGERQCEPLAAEIGFTMGSDTSRSSSDGPWNFPSRAA